MTVPLYTLDAGATFRYGGETWRVVTQAGEAVWARDSDGAIIVFGSVMQVTAL